MKDGAVVAEPAAAEADVTTLHRLMVGRGLQAEYYREPLQTPYRDEVAGRGATASALAGAYRDVELQAARGRDPRHRRRDRLGPRGADAARWPASRRTTAGTLSDRRPRGALALARPRRSTAASATSRASGAPRAWCCSCRSPPTSRWPSLESLRRRGLIDTRAERRLASDWVERLQHPHARHRHALPQPLRRQPAEGRAGEVAERASSQHPDPRPSDARPRRRRQGGGLRAGPRRHGRGHRASS